MKSGHALGIALLLLPITRQCVMRGLCVRSDVSNGELKNQREIRKKYRRVYKKKAKQKNKKKRRLARINVPFLASLYVLTMIQ